MNNSHNKFLNFFSNSPPSPPKNNSGNCQPGIRKPTVPEKIYQPHVFQQSVTLTASMWDENDSKGKMDWSFDNWGVLSKYSPLFVGLVCGFAVVLLIMSSVMLWRYCVISASNKLSCKNTYGEVTAQQQKSVPIRKENIGNLAGFENFHRFETSCSQPTLQRCATVGSVPLHNLGTSVRVEDIFLHQGVSSNNIFLHLRSPTRLQDSNHYAEPVIPSDNYTSHSYLQELEAQSSEIENLSRSAPGLEDLYAKVNFSKKRKNRMRRDEAAIIAFSKSRNGQNNDSLESFGSAVVVYNERTAL